MATALQVLQLLVPIFLIVLFASGLTYFIVRKYVISRKQASLLPLHKEQGLAPTPATSGHRRRSSIYVSADASAQQFHGLISDPEKRELAKASTVTTITNVPEIHITLPEEADSDGNTSPRRTVVVHLNEKGAEVGLEPLHDEQLPPYERFVSLDLERLGGLKEKEVSA